MTTYTIRPEPGPRSGWLVCRLGAGGYWEPLKRYETREEAQTEELRLRREAVRATLKGKRKR